MQITFNPFPLFNIRSRITSFKKILSNSMHTLYYKCEVILLKTMRETRGQKSFWLGNKRR